MEGLRRWGRLKARGGDGVGPRGVRESRPWSFGIRRESTRMPGRLAPGSVTHPDESTSTLRPQNMPDGLPPRLPATTLIVEEEEEPALAEFFFEDLIPGAEVRNYFLLFGGCSNRPRWRAGVARAGERSLWLTRCGGGEKSSIGPRRGPVNGLNGPTGKEPQAPSPGQLQSG
jgi:hypothetical protein